MADHDHDHDSGKPDDAVSQLEVGSSEAHRLPLSSPQAGSQDGAVKAESKWNTKNLALRMAADFVSAAAAASLVAPLISIIDR